MEVPLREDKMLMMVVIRKEEESVGREGLYYGKRMRPMRVPNQQSFRKFPVSTKYGTLTT